MFQPNIECTKQGYISGCTKYYRCTKQTNGSYKKETYSCGPPKFPNRPVFNKYGYCGPLEYVSENF